ncbi:hypothetical protein Tco_0681145 [Tanacetum coccineum]|uniref:Uncharacterized protein n=1 Tax=Tanacetum coccineum TaxID=301880 RepID=A0ABQ4XNB6_9ASTR
MVVQNQSELGEGSANPIDPHYTPTFIQPSTQPQKTQKPRKPKRKDTQVPQPSDPSENVTDEVVHKEWGDSWVTCWRRPLLLLVGCVVIYVAASSLEAEQDSGAKKPWGDTNCLIRIENVSKHSNDSLLARGNILRSNEDRLKLNELMELCITLQKKVLDLEKTKTTQHNEIASLKRRVKKLEKKIDEDITLVNVQDDADNEMFDVNVLNGEEVFVAGQNENVVEEVVDADKGKGIMIEEPVKPMKKKVQIMLDEEAALKLQTEFDEEERLVREKAKKEKEANIALIEE